MTNNPPYTPPAFGKKTFNCPYCHAYADQHWSVECTYLYDCDDEPTYGGYSGDIIIEEGSPISSPEPIRFSKCHRCKKSCLWFAKKLAVPNNHGMPPPNSDLPANVKELYNEAASIVQKSSRAAVALLRVALERLLGKLGGEGSNNYEKIQNFMNETNPPQEIVEMMHAIRDTGNDAVHIGKINFGKRSKIPKLLFHFINDIAEETLTKERIRKERLKKYDNIKPAKKRKTE